MAAWRCDLLACRQNAGEKKGEPMAQYVRDPVLMDLAKELEMVEFSDVGFLNEDIEKRHAEGELFHNVAKGRIQRDGSRMFFVRFSFGKRQRIIGATSVLHRAVRFADLATLYFWKYRTRGGVAPEDRHFNLSKEEAEAALRVETDVLNLLERIEEYLLDIHALGDPVEATRIRSERMKTLEPRKAGVLRTLKENHKQLLSLVDEMFSQIITLTGEVRNLAARLNGVASIPATPCIRDIATVDLREDTSKPNPLWTTPTGQTGS